MADANVPLIYLDVLVHHLALLSACTSRPLCNPSITIVFLEILARQEQVQQLCDDGRRSALCALHFPHIFIAYLLQVSFDAVGWILLQLLMF